MDQLEQWSERLLEAEEQLAGVYEAIASLHAELREAGRKKDAQALGEVVDRLARYGRLFQDMRATWADPDA